MKYLLRNAQIYRNGGFVGEDIRLQGGRISELGKGLKPTEDEKEFDLSGCIVIPALTDVHVHFREPGFTDKETIATGSMAAAHGGYAHICTMPNLNPMPDCPEGLQKQLDAIAKDAMVNIYPYGTITKGEAGEELSPMREMADRVVGFSDDGRGVQMGEMMAEAMRTAKDLGKIIAAHCEDNSLLRGGYIHDGEYARLHGHKGICSESEWGQIARDIELVKETGCKYHVCHISTAESVEVIRQAKAQGVDISCETAPHYLLLNDMCLQEEGRFKMNPPIRAERDRLALIEGICDGTVDMIATDHAPHTAEEKSKGLKDSMMGVVGLETAFALLYTGLVREGIISKEKLIELMSVNPNARFGIGSSLQVGEPADIAVFNINEKYIINPDAFCSKGRSTPFEGREVYGVCKMTIVNGRIVWQENLTGN